MVYLDQRGVGRSTSPAEADYSMDRMVKDFEEVRKALGIRKWVTMGHSFGGILQMGYAEGHPEAIEGMIMVNCTLDLTESCESSWIPKAVEILDVEDAAPYTDEVRPLVERVSELGERLRAEGLFWKMAYAAEESENSMNASYAEIPDWNHDFAGAAMTIEDYWRDFRPATAKVTAPVLFFYGNKDWMIGPGHHGGVHFPKMILWGSDVGHVAIIENKSDLDRAITAYRTEFGM
jgi:proline iminopeptidase